jgi:uncharacterized OB-fold protein
MTVADTLDTTIDQAPALHAQLNMPYTLTTGAAAGRFLAELAQQRLLASRCDACDRTVVPARDYCGQCGGDSSSQSFVAPVGTISAITRTAAGAVALIRIDGADSDLLHRVTGDVGVGSRVVATWAPETTSSILDLAAFVELTGDAPAAPRTAEPVEAIQQLPYNLQLNYQHAYGPHYGRMFDEIAARRRVLGSKCPQCKNVLVPPREMCDVCFVRTAQYVDVADTGRLQAFSVIEMEFVGQTRKPPYVYAEIVLDGSATRLIHNVAGFDVQTAQEKLWIGMPVRAVWKDATEATGTLTDIDFFEPIDE